MKEKVKQIISKINQSERYDISGRTGRILRREVYQELLSVINSLQDTEWDYGYKCLDLKKSLIKLDSRPENTVVCIPSEYIIEIRLFLGDVLR